MVAKKTIASGNLNYTAGLDIGNGYVKGLIRHRGETKGGHVIDMPSAVTRVTKPNQLPLDDMQAVHEVQDFVNKADVTFNSPLVADTYRRLTGTRSLTSSGSLDEFTLVGNTSKAHQELSKVLVLTALASAAVTDFVETTGRIPRAEGAHDSDPGVLDVRATVALALPINEYVNHRDSYAAAFTGSQVNTGTKGSGSRRKKITHTVTVNNFVTPVICHVVFDEVVVIAEGASAQYAISAGGVEMAEAMLADVRVRGLALEGITGSDVLAATHTVGVDVGEGTVNFPVFTDGKFNTDASRAFAQGYGTVLEQAIEAMTDEGFNHGFHSRKQLADYLNTPPKALKQNFYNRVKMYVERQAEFFVADVAAEFSRVLSTVGALTEVAYVYGGGSGPLQELLHPALMAAAADMNSEDTFPVLYLDAQYSRKLNRQGLQLAAETVVKRQMNTGRAQSVVSTEKGE